MIINDLQDLHFLGSENVYNIYADASFNHKSSLGCCCCIVVKNNKVIAKEMFKYTFYSSSEPELYAATMFIKDIPKNSTLIIHSDNGWAISIIKLIYDRKKLFSHIFKRMILVKKRDPEVKKRQRLILNKIWKNMTTNIQSKQILINQKHEFNCDFIKACDRASKEWLNRNCHLIFDSIEVDTFERL